jgi:hypothetical protein
MTAVINVSDCLVGTMNEQIAKWVCGGTVRRINAMKVCWRPVPKKGEPMTSIVEKNESIHDAMMVLYDFFGEYGIMDADYLSATGHQFLC